ncbi:MAG: hypothetical protein K9K79_01590 [Desulfohalobiaceae bacterium]|nr:hypothetical protein [Desulfohalobiaceae bacterium]
MSEQNTRLEDWLATGQGLKLLQRCAWIIDKQVNTVNTGGALPFAHYKEELINDLWIFLRELPLGRRQEMRQMVLEKNVSKLCTVISRMYVNRLYDLRRTKEQSGWHAYYRHVRSVLAAAPEITYRPFRQQSWYAWSETDPEIFHDLSDLDFASWPRPDLKATEIRKRESIYHLAKRFWNEAADRAGQPCLVSIKDLVRYVGSHFPQELLAPNIKGEHEMQYDDQGSDQASILEQISAELPPAEQILTSARLGQLAEQFTAGLDEQEQTIWFLRYDREMKLEQIAEHLGYQSAGSVLYQIRKVEFKFKEFCTLWPGLSAEDLDDRLAENFFLLVLENCKNKVGNRNTR